MKKVVAAYVSVALCMLVLDVVWIGFVARTFYLQGIGHLMAASPRLDAALLFYAVYALGLVVFVVAPQAQKRSGSWLSTLLRGALFGVVAYATYDLTNLATLRDWPVRVTLVDMAWGALASGCASLAGYAAWRRFAHYIPFA